MAQPSAQWRLLAQAARVTDGMRALEVSSAREWLEAHGDGSFALGTISGALTRRYHGWLVAATPPPAGRAVLLSKVDELATANGAVQRLSSNVFVAGQHDGTASFESFTAVPFPTWTLRVGEALFEWMIVAAHGEAMTLV